jgi:predicted outer membrane lipoprotein
MLTAIWSIERLYKSDKIGKLIIIFKMDHFEDYSICLAPQLSVPELPTCSIYEEPGWHDVPVRLAVYISRAEVDCVFNISRAEVDCVFTPLLMCILGIIIALILDKIDVFCRPSRIAQAQFLYTHTMMMTVMILALVHCEMFGLIEANITLALRPILMPLLACILGIIEALILDKMIPDVHYFTTKTMMIGLMVFVCCEMFGLIEANITLALAEVIYSMTDSMTIVLPKVIDSMTIVLLKVIDSMNIVLIKVNDDTYDCLQAC